MTQEQKDLILKDLCARLPYGIKAHVYNHWSDDFKDETITIENLYQLIETFSIEDIKPYLFPMSSMTEEQKEDMIKSSCGYGSDKNVFDWYNKNHFDYRGLIEKGLALDATGLNIY